MMPQKEISEVMHTQVRQGYGRYEGYQTDGPRQSYETYPGQDVREGPSSKVYPPSRSKIQIFRLAMPVIALGMLLFFGYLFVIGVGGTAGWTSFVAACFVILGIMAYTSMIDRPGDRGDR